MIQIKPLPVDMDTWKQMNYDPLYYVAKTNKFKLELINGISKETSFEKIGTNKCFDYSFYYKYDKIYVLAYN